MIKTYPRARISRHPNLNGWVIDLIQREGFKPKRVAATYSTIVWADRAARAKLPAGSSRLVPVPPTSAAAPTSAQRRKDDAGKCDPCDRPMRRPGEKAADHPGTVLRQREGLCQSCNRKEQFS